MKDKEEAIVCLLSSAKGFAWRAGGCFVSVQRTFVQNFWVGALSPDHIRSHVGRERTAWNLTGVGEGKKKGGDFSFRLRVYPRPVGMWKWLWEPTHPGGPCVRSKQFMGIGSVKSGSIFKTGRLYGRMTLSSGRVA